MFVLSDGSDERLYRWNCHGSCFNSGQVAVGGKQLYGCPVLFPACQCDDVIRGARVSRSREQRAASYRTERSLVE